MRTHWLDMALVMCAHNLKAFDEVKHLVSALDTDGTACVSNDFVLSVMSISAKHWPDQQIHDGDCVGVLLRQIAAAAEARPPGLGDMVASGLPDIGITENQSLCGTELKSLLLDWLGIESTPTCSCNAMARQMDTLGPDWAEGEGMAEILDVMRTEHAKRWQDGRTILPWTDAGARQLVLLACRRSRAKASS